MAGTALYQMVTTLFLAQVFGVDRIPDMCRTTVNVTGDLVAATVLDLGQATEGEAPAGATRASA